VTLLKVLSLRSLSKIIDDLTTNLTKTRITDFHEGSTESETLVKQLISITSPNDINTIANHLKKEYLKTGNTRSIVLFITLINHHFKQSDKEAYIVYSKELSETTRGLIFHRKKEYLETLLNKLNLEKHIKNTLLKAEYLRQETSKNEETHTEITIDIRETIADLCLTAAFSKLQNGEPHETEKQILELLFNHGADKERFYFGNKHFEYTTYAYLIEDI
jgi:hypothetical protein